MNDERIEEVKEIIKESNGRMGPDEAIELLDKGELPLFPVSIDLGEIEFNERDGFYEVIMENGGHYRICCVCGEVQPMNKTAYKRNFPGLWEREDIEEEDIRWNNSNCEQRHKPFNYVHETQ